VKVLSGWKEIAKYLGRGVRTAQRWEPLGLPVHRPTGKGRSAVTALAHELDAWVETTPKRAANVAELLAEIAKLQAENEMLKRGLAGRTSAPTRQVASGSMSQA
jgi:phage terminase Nu1 subunit (DNA packaging protein)